MKKLILIASLFLAGCATQTPLQGIIGGLDQLKDNKVSAQWRIWAEDALKHTDTLNLDPVQADQAKACPVAILKVQEQKSAMIERWKAHLAERDAQLTASFNPIIAAQDLKFGKDPETAIKADEAEIIGWGEYLLHSCSNLFPTDKAIDLARKVWGMGL